MAPIGASSAGWEMPMSSATLLTVAIILTLVAVYQWTARLGVLGVAQMELMARYWQGVLGTTALAGGSWLAWLTV
jgi:hypothetical protein